MGGIYTLGTQPGTIIRSNVFHDIVGHQYGGWGIYFDEGSTGIVAENNLVYRTSHGGFHQHYGKDNIVRNNILAFGRDAQIMLTRPEKHRSFTFERNIVYGTRRVCWVATGKAISTRCRRIFSGGRTGSCLGLPAGFQSGHSVIADPLFVAPANADFSLRPESAGLPGLGFKPIEPPIARSACVSSADGAIASRREVLDRGDYSCQNR